MGVYLVVECLFFPVCPFFCLSICLSVCLSVSLFDYPSFLSLLTFSSLFPTRFLPDHISSPTFLLFIFLPIILHPPFLPLPIPQTHTHVFPPFSRVRTKRTRMSPPSRSLFSARQLPPSYFRQYTFIKSLIKTDEMQSVSLFISRLLRHKHLHNQLKYIFILLFLYQLQLLAFLILHSSFRSRASALSCFTLYIYHCVI